MAGLRIVPRVPKPDTLFRNVTTRLSGDQLVVKNAAGGDLTRLTLSADEQAELRAQLPERVAPAADPAHDPTPAPAPSPIPDGARVAHALADFDQRNATAGTLIEADGAIAATYNGGGVNGFARGIFEVKIGEGQRWRAGAQFFLPAGFLASAGYVSLLRRDNWPTYESGGNTSGVAVYQSDDRAHLCVDSYDGHWLARSLAAASLPEGRWFTLEIDEVVSSTPSGSGRLLIDKVQVASYAGQNNIDGRTAERVRYGIVAISPQAAGYGLQMRDCWVRIG